MKALTVCQPYAELIARGEKTIENRTWPTSYRGPLAIHAGKSKGWMDRFDIVNYPKMAFGAVVSLVQLVDCFRLDRLPEELKSNEHANGPFCWVLADSRRVVPHWINGAQGLWELSDDLVANLKFPEPAEAPRG